MKISSDDKDVKLKRIAGPFIFLHSTAHLLPLCLRREGTGVRCQKSEVGGRREGTGVRCQMSEVRDEGTEGCALSRLVVKKGRRDGGT
jgi:hypothetical protein